ncbi:LytR family transcriptional regulator [Streptomyces montanus]|uniref:LytR family transcriptional regulator n=1 Tax=Streptomyces montanus TaxID=2580423 RepID=A0A5R9FWA0_9ACTN|nr:LCP family protein [Streptomyces montanus]TLS46939.1 LytR family transcriptional regulator [Streptomyces montanus]
MQVRDLFPDRRWVRLVALGFGLLLIAAVAVGGGTYAHLDGNIRSDDVPARALHADRAVRPKSMAPGAQNILLLGSDLEAVRDSQRSDVTILLHLSADRRRAALVSVPRDLMVQIPRCRKPDGGTSRAQFAQFNWAFQFGGAACAIRTFEELTGVRVDHHLIIDFTGFRKVVDAMGGVQVDVPQKVKVPGDKLVLRPGKQHLNGHQALILVRGRSGVGDGSDLQRIERQKVFLRDLLAGARSGGVLEDTTRLFPVLNALTRSLTADPGLDSLRELYGLVNSAAGIPQNRTSIVTIPSVEDPDRWGRYKPVKRQAKALFKALREDKPLPTRLYNAYDPANDEL